MNHIKELVMILLGYHLADPAVFAALQTKAKEMGTSLEDLIINKLKLMEKGTPQNKAKGVLKEKGRLKFEEFKDRMEYKPPNRLEKPILPILAPKNKLWEKI